MEQVRCFWIRLTIIQEDVIQQSLLTVQYIIDDMIYKRRINGDLLCM